MKSELVEAAISICILLILFVIFAHIATGMWSPEEIIRWMMCIGRPLEGCEVY